jgi:hypothetical protein
MSCWTVAASSAMDTSIRSRSDRTKHVGWVVSKVSSQDSVETRLPLVDPFSSCTVSYKLAGLKGRAPAL